MGAIGVWSRLIGVLSLVALRPASAQIPVIPINPFARSPFTRPPAEPRLGDAPLPPVEKERVRRLQVGAYAAHWEFAPVRVQGAREQLDVGISYLIGLDYFVTRDLSLGAWQNPFHGPESAREPEASRAEKIADVDARFRDVHATYYPPLDAQRTLSLQIGFSQIRDEVHIVPREIPIGHDFVRTDSSLNFWLNKTQVVGARKIGGRPEPIRVFGSVGYYTSSDPQFNRAWNLIVGGAVPLTKDLSFSSSVWFNDFRHVSTRITAGLSSRF